MPKPPLWAPWRIDYILSTKSDGCFLCDGALDSAGEEELVVWTGRTAFVLLNRHPYAPGHLMVSPRQHVGELDAVEDEVLVECARLVQLSTRVLAETMEPDGFNVGLNLGAAAGAGVPGHLHWHVVPRWEADTNFMPLLADVRVIPEHLRATWRRLAAMFEGAAAAAGLEVQESG